MGNQAMLDDALSRLVHSTLKACDSLTVREIRKATASDLNTYLIGTI